VQLDPYRAAALRSRLAASREFTGTD